VSWTLAAHLAATAAYAGFQWTVQGLVYPQFAEVPAAGFAAHERAHQRRVSRVVGPLFAALAVTTALVLVTRPGVVAVLSAACYAVVLAATAFAAVPLHRRLSAGFDAAAHRRLLRVDLVRALAATADVVCALLLAAGRA
jgi:hypothetical protein